MSVNILLVPILFPLAVGILTFFIPKRVKWIREALAIVTTALVLAAALWIFFGDAQDIHIPLFEMGAFDLTFALAANPLSACILVFAAGFCFIPK